MQVFNYRFDCSYYGVKWYTKSVSACVLYKLVIVKVKYDRYLKKYSGHFKVLSM